MTQMDWSKGTFFRPVDGFVPWLLEYAQGRMIVDCGAGFGDLVASLLDQDPECGAVGIEQMASKVEEGVLRALASGATEGQRRMVRRILIGDTVDHSFLQHPKALAVFARPCHGPWVRLTLESSHHVVEALYISKPGNVQRDLEGLEWCPLGDAVVGEEGERVYKVRRTPPDNDRRFSWALVRQASDHAKTTSTELHWLRYIPSNPHVWYRDEGPVRLPRFAGDVVVDEACTSDMDWLDWPRTTLWQMWDRRVRDLSLDNGWCSPEGTFYRCAYWEHDELAAHYLRRSIRDLERTGWARVQRRSKDEPHLIVTVDKRGHGIGDGRLTQQQVQGLLDAGISLSLWHIEDAEGDWSDLIQRLRAEEGQDFASDCVPPPEQS